MKSKLTYILVFICLSQAGVITYLIANNRAHKIGENHWEIELKRDDYFRFTSNPELKVFDILVDDDWISMTGIHTKKDTSVTVMFEEDNVSLSTMVEVDGTKTSTRDEDGDGIPDKRAIKGAKEKNYTCFEHIETTWEMCPNTKNLTRQSGQRR